MGQINICRRVTPYPFRQASEGVEQGVFLYLNAFGGNERMWIYGDRR